MNMSIFMQKTSNLFLENSLLKFFIVVLGIAMVINSFFTYSMARNQKVVMIPPGLDRQAEVSDRNADEAYLRAMTRYALSLMLTSSPANARKQFSELLLLLHPRVYAQRKSEFYDLADRMEKASATSVFIIGDIKFFEDADGKGIEVSGIRRIYASDKQVEDGSKTYIMRYTVEQGRFYLLQIAEKTERGG